MWGPIICSFFVCFFKIKYVPISTSLFFNIFFPLTYPIVIIQYAMHVTSKMYWLLPVILPVKRRLLEVEFLVHQKQGSVSLNPVSFKGQLSCGIPLIWGISRVVGFIEKKRMEAAKAGRKEMRNYCLMGIEFVLQDENVLEIGCTRLAWEWT